MKTSKGVPVAELRLAIKSLDSASEKLLNAQQQAERARLVLAVKRRFVEVEKILTAIK